MLLTVCPVDAHILLEAKESWGRFLIFLSFAETKLRWNFWILFLKIVYQKGFFREIKKIRIFWSGAGFSILGTLQSDNGDIHENVAEK